MQPTQTLDSSLNKFQEYNAFPENVVHSFASKTAETTALLKELVETTDDISESLTAYANAPWTNPKLISLLRQGSSIAQTLHTSETQSRHIISALRNRNNINYGESIPLIPAQIPDWCISRLQNWCELAGLQAFLDDTKPKDTPTIILGGNVIVVDIDFVIERTNPLKPRVSVSRVKTSYAIPSAQSTSTALDGFLLNIIQAFCVEVQQPEDVRDPQKAAKLGENVLLQLQYLVMLDQLTQRQHDGGLKWFTALDEVGPTVEGFAVKEASAIASSLSQPHVPLDIFLRRSHGLPIPYLLAPSLSFLVYISPLAYLSMISDIPESLQPQQNSPIPLDIPLPFLRSTLAESPPGTTLATLRLIRVFVPSLGGSSTFASRPTFPLVSAGSEINYDLPKLSDDLMLTGDSETGQYEWILDFTNNGRVPGIVMSQSRMREIELVLNPLGGGIGGMDVMASLHAFRGSSWVDLLLNPEPGKSSEFYVATYTSPSQAHPPLKLRLTAPEEPGFRLQQVPVHTLKEVWGILEIVREQSWLNEMLNGCDWRPEELVTPDTPNDHESPDVDLNSILTGSYQPRHLPINVYLPHHNVSTDTVFDPLSVSTNDRR
ncbi:hypothetical protein CC2G_009126 [Coprinopsis cinerea AmutBmut pab1-1]|nr:hypothetical protein CC2G_009126 [Coprinopsis cinerea AmutBmut pab1-1]